MTFNTPEAISAYRLLMLASALKLETKGIYPIKGNKLKVLSQFDEMLIEAGIKQAK